MKELKSKLISIIELKAGVFVSEHSVRPDMICVSERLYDALISPEHDFIGMTVNITNADDPNHIILLCGEDGNSLSFFIKDKEIENALMHSNII